MADRRLQPRDVYNIVNFMVENITGQVNQTRVLDTSTFVSAGETLLKYDTESIFNSLALIIGRTLIASREYTGKFDIIKAINTGVFSHRLEKISYYADEALPSGIVNTDLFTNLYQGYTNGQNKDGEGVAQSTKSQWEQNRLYPLTMYFGGSNYWDYNITRDEVALYEAFRSPDMFNEFVTGMLIEHQNTIESGLEAYRRATLLNYMAGIYAMGNDMPGSVVNLTAEFNSRYNTEYLTQDLLSTYLDEFLSFLVERIEEITDRLTHRSIGYHWSPAKQITVDGQTKNLVLLRHTPKDRQKVVLYKPAIISATANVLPKIFNPQMLDINKYEGVDYWQFEDEALAPTINVTPTIPDGLGGQKKADAVTIPYVLGCIFDEDACLIDYVLERGYSTSVEARKGYRNLWLHYAFNSINDFTEKGVLLVMMDPPTNTRKAKKVKTEKAKAEEAPVEEAKVEE